MASDNPSVDVPGDDGIKAGSRVWTVVLECLSRDETVRPDDLAGFSDEIVNEVLTAMEDDGYVAYDQDGVWVADDRAAEMLRWVGQD